MSYALIFSGQGTQHAHMLPWLEQQEPAQAVLAAVARHTGGDWRGVLSDEECRLTNALAQPLIVGTALAAWAALRSLLSTSPAIVAGYSVGEIAACSAAGMLSAQEAVTLAARRARLMDSAVAGNETGMVAVSGIAERDVLATCTELETAIRIDDETNVFGGARAALAKAQAALGDRAQLKRICVALASHTSWMRDATAAFQGALKEVRFEPPDCPIVLNATGETAKDVGAIVPSLALQLSRPVEWSACMAAIAERRPACVLEIGGGQALARMWTARYPQIPARSLDEFRTSGGAATWIARQNLP
jgi:[acyl-carrier-protein] S-malonyltransferase